MNKVRINQGRIVMWQFRVAGTLLVFFIIGLALSRLEEFTAISVSIAVSFLLPFLWSSYYIFEISPSEKTISKYHWLAGFKINVEVTNFLEIEKIYVNPVKMNQNVHSYHTGSVRSFKCIEYKAFLKLSDNNKFFLLSSNDPENIKNRLLPVAKKLNCDLVYNF